MNRRAFTLLEVVLYVFVFGTLSVALYNFGSISFQANARSQAAAEVELSGAALMLKIVGLINNAPQMFGVNYPLASSSSSTLSLVGATSSTDPVILAISDGRLTMKQGASSSVALSGSRVVATELNFVNLGTSSTNDIIQVSFKLEMANSGLKDFIYSQTFRSAAQSLRR